LGLQQYMEMGYRRLQPACVAMANNNALHQLATAPYYTLISG